MEYDIVVHYQTDTSKKVSEWLGEIFDHMSGARLIVSKPVARITSEKPLTQSEIDKLSAEFVKVSKEHGIKFDKVVVVEVKR